MPKNLFDWPKKISAHPTARLTWEVTYDDGRVETQGVLITGPWRGGPLGKQEGRVLAGKIQKADLQPWWVTQRLKWHADALDGRKPYRSREISPAFRKSLEDIRAMRRQLESARDAIDGGGLYRLKLATLHKALSQGIDNFKSDESEMVARSRRTLGEFLRGLKQRCGLTVDELALLLRGHPENLERLRSGPRGGKEQGDIVRWVRSVMAPR
jgi:hypothetical protein